MKADWVMGDMRAEWLTAVPEVEAWYEGNGLQATPHELKAAAWRLVMAKQYERIRSLGLPANDYEARNNHLLNTVGWNLKEEGGFGGFIADITRRGSNLATQLAGTSPVLVPPAVALMTITRFGNAIGTLLNRKLTFMGLGFAPGAFGVMEVEIDPRTGVARNGSPWVLVQTRIAASARLKLLAGAPSSSLCLRWPRWERSWCACAGPRTRKSVSCGSGWAGNPAKWTSRLAAANTSPSA